MRLRLCSVTVTIRHHLQQSSPAVTITWYHPAITITHHHHPPSPSPTIAIAITSITPPPHHHEPSNPKRGAT
jgi:hypothetical protein